jgi:hypothetical protein
MIEGSSPDSNLYPYNGLLDLALEAQILMDPVDLEYCLAQQFWKMTCLEWPIPEDDMLGMA